MENFDHGSVLVDSGSIVQCDPMTRVTKMTISTFVTAVTTDRCYHVDRGDQIGQGDVDNQGDGVITVTSEQGDQSERIDKGEVTIIIYGILRS